MITLIEKVQLDHEAKLKVDQLKAADTAAAERTRDLLEDPHTPVLGNPNGDVAIIEFFDYQSPFCKAVEPRLRQLNKYDGRVKLIMKEFPILSPASLVASKAALASVAQGKYEAFHQALMDDGGQLDNDRIFKIASELKTFQFGARTPTDDVGLDVERLRQDMGAPEIADQIISNFNLARRLKISVVPGFLVNTHVLSGLTAETDTSKILFFEEVNAARANQM